MPSKFRVRRIFGSLVKKIAHRLGQRGLTPNGATWSMLCFAISSSAILYFTQLEWLFGICVFMTGIMDGVDGSIARQFGRSSKTGELFDSFADRLSEVILALGLLLYFAPKQVILLNLSIKTWIAFMVMGSILVSYVRARAEIITRGDFDRGLFARSERLFTLAIFSWFSLLPFSGDLPGGSFLAIGIFILMIGANSTAFYRVFIYRKILRQLDTIQPKPNDLKEQ